MIRAAASLDPAAPPSADVLIVGSGPVGLAMALRLAARGLRPLVLEAGGPRHERALQDDVFAAEAISPVLHYGTTLYRRRGLGGTSALWGGRCIPLDPSDFAPTPRRAGWPIPAEAVAAHLPDALAFLEAGLPEFTARLAFPDDPDPALPARHADLALDGIERFSRPTHLWRRHREAIGRSAAVLVVHGATCVAVETTAEGNLATGLRIADAAGRETVLRAPRVVLAAGGIETARLLLASDAVRNCGLGNEHDMVGRCYMTHLGGTISEIVLRTGADRARLDYRVTHDGIYGRSLLKLSAAAARRENAVAAVFRPAIRPVWDARHGDAVLSAMFLVRRLVAPEYARRFAARDGDAAGSAALSRHAANLLRGLPRLAAFGADWTRRRILATRKLPSVFLAARDGVYPLEFDAEHLPCRDSRIALGSGRDRFGMRRIRLAWRVPESNLEGLAAAIRGLRRALADSGAAELRATEADIAAALRACDPIGGHHIGTARMGADPAGSVVDPEGEVWGTRRLFVAGAAVFPTSGFANPTLTAVALALRQADHIARGLPRG